MQVSDGLDLVHMVDFVVVAIVGVPVANVHRVGFEGSLLLLQLSSGRRLQVEG